MGLGMFVGGLGAGQLAALVIHIVMPLRRAIDAIGPVQASVEPLRAVGRRALAGQHMTHFVEIGAGVFFGGEISALPAPVGPGPGEPVENLLGGGFALHRRTFGGNRPPEELGHILFLHRARGRRHAGLAEVFLRDDVGGDLAPARGDFHVVELEDDGTVRVSDFGHRGHEIQIAVGILPGLGEFPFNLHLSAASSSSVIFRARRSPRSGS